MSRRVFLAILSVVLVAIAAAPWTTTSSRIRASVIEQVKVLSGLDLAVDGRATIAFLPVPRVKFSDITLATPDGVKLVEGGQLRGEVRLLPLFAARIELTELSLNQSRITVAIDGDGRSDWDASLARLRGFFGDADGSGKIVRRLALRDCSITIRDARHLANADLSDADIVLSWPVTTRPLTAAGSFVWKTESISFALSDVMPAALMGGGSSPFALTAKGSAGALDISGETRFTPDFEMKGQTAIATGSLRGFTRWSGLPLPLADLVSTFALEGAFTANAREISWPSARMSVGKDRLDGSLAILHEASRPLIRATLASNDVDLSALIAPFTSIRAENGAWVNDPFIPRMASAGNIDLRLSASLAQFGRLKIQDMAAALLLTDSRLEISVARAGFERGTLKGRMALGVGSGFFDLKTQGVFDKIDIAALLTQLGQKSWLSGQAQGQFALEAFGESPDDLIRQLSGRAGMSLRQGELSGVAFDDLLRRLERRPIVAPFEWRGGRTAFESGQLGLQIANGVAEITEGTLTGPAVKTSLAGRISLPDRTLGLRALAEAAPSLSPPSSVAFAIEGPWGDIGIVPDVAALIRRSDAARSLIAR